MNDRLLQAIKKLKEQQDDMQVEFKQIQKQLDKSGNFYLQRLMRQMEEDISNYSIQDGYWYFNGRNTGIKAEGIDGKDGSIGPQGKPGKDGAPGKPGRDGKDGKPGKDGAPGRDGKDGAPGRDGKDGKDGKDAVIPTFKIGKVETSPEYGGANAKFRIGKDGSLYLDLVLPRGPQGFPGFDGKDAKINGTSTLNIEAGENITLEQNGDTLKINSTGGGTGTITDVKVNGTSVVTDGVANVTAYQKPSGGIPDTDLSSAVQTSLGKADTALQSETYTGTITSVKMNGTTIASSGEADLGTVITEHQDMSGKEDKSNKVTSMSSSSTDTQYPSAKAVYDALNSDLLHCKGHVNSVNDLPSVGQPSGSPTTSNLTINDRTNYVYYTGYTDHLSGLTSYLGSTYQYYIGMSKEWLSSGSTDYAGITTNYPECIDGFSISAYSTATVTPKYTYYPAIHITYDASKPVYVKVGSSTRFTLDSTGTYAGSNIPSNTLTLVTESCWLPLCYSGVNSSSVPYHYDKLYSNISGLKFKPFTGTAFMVDGQSQTLNNKYTSITNTANYTYVEDYDIFKFDDGYGEWITGEAVAKTNEVYTVGDNYEIYRCNSTPAWEHWSATDTTGLEATSNKVTSLSNSSTDTQYPSAKCVYDLIGDVESLLSEV